jgi:hypothetical protein
MVNRSNSGFARSVVALVFAAGTTLAWAIDPAPPPLATIIQNVVARDEANQKALQSMQYHEALRTERLDDQGRVVKREELRMIVRPGARVETEVLSEKGDDLPVDPDQASLQAKGKEAQKQNVNFALKDMVSRFHVTFAGSATFAGQPVYVLAFEPRPNQPYRDQTEKVLNHLHGRLWVSTRDYNVLQTEATLAQPVELAWIFAEVTDLNFRYVLNNTTGGMGPSRIETTVKVHVPFLNIFHQHTLIDLAQFQPRT